MRILNLITCSYCRPCVDVLKGLLHTRFGLPPSLCWSFRGVVVVVVELKRHCSSERLQTGARRHPELTRRRRRGGGGEEELRVSISFFNKTENFHFLTPGLLQFSTPNTFPYSSALSLEIFVPLMLAHLILHA